jgi:hypothetical protein
MRKLILVSVLFLFVTIAAQAQLDVQFGLSTTSGKNPASADLSHAPVNIGGGAYPFFAADYKFFHNFGVGGEITWRGSQSLWGGQIPYRPLFYSINGVFAPRFKSVGVDLQAGIGAESVRFYTGQTTCSYFSGCSNYQSTNHFMGHFGGGLRLYPKGNFFIEPQVHEYFVRNNFEFSGPRVTRYGLSIGYSWGGFMP